LKNLHDAFWAELRGCDTPEHARRLAIAMVQLAELAHPGPWKVYLADVCGMGAVPNDWHAHFGPHVQKAWDFPVTKM
jgi:hypothetical protein